MSDFLADVPLGFEKDDKKLIWSETNRKTLLQTPIFSVCETTATSPLGKVGNYSVLESASWAIVIPEIIIAPSCVGTSKGGKYFVMVKQWRHGAKKLSVEFPGGVIESGEDPSEGAKRELREETGFTAGKLTALGCMSPNPAIMANDVYFFLAQDLVKEGNQELDADEFVNVQLVCLDTLVRSMGKPPYIHSLMASALCLYFNEIKK